MIQCLYFIKNLFQMTTTISVSQGFLYFTLLTYMGKLQQVFPLQCLIPSNCCLSQTSYFLQFFWLLLKPSNNLQMILELCEMSQSNQHQQMTNYYQFYSLHPRNKVNSNINSKNSVNFVYTCIIVTEILLNQVI